MSTNDELLGLVLAAKQAHENLRMRTEGLLRRKIDRVGAFDPGILDAAVEAAHSHLFSVLDQFDVTRSRSAAAWLLTITHHAAIDYLRRHQPAVPLHAIPEPGDDHSLPLGGEHEREVYREMLHSALSLVSSPKRREILLLLAFAGPRNYDEIARVMHLSGPSAARQLKYNALKEIRDILRRMGCGSEAVAQFFR